MCFFFCFGKHFSGYRNVSNYWHRLFFILSAFVKNKKKTSTEIKKKKKSLFLKLKILKMYYGNKNNNFKKKPTRNIFNKLIKKMKLQKKTIISRLYKTIIK